MTENFTSSLMYLLNSWDKIFVALFKNSLNCSLTSVTRWQSIVNALNSRDQTQLLWGWRVRKGGTGPITSDRAPDTKARSSARPSPALSHQCPETARIYRGCQINPLLATLHISPYPYQNLVSAGLVAADCPADAWLDCSTAGFTSSSFISSVPSFR